MEDFIATFHIDWKLMLAQAFNFLLVLAIFYFLAAKPLRKLMKSRTEEIEGGIENALKNAETLAKTKEEYEIALREARTEATAILERGKKEADIKRAEMVEETKAEVTKMLEKGKKDLEAEKSKMVAEAKRELAGLVVSATEKVVGRSPIPLDEKTIKELSNI